MCNPPREFAFAGMARSHNHEPAVTTATTINRQGRRQIKHHGHSANCGSGPCPRPETNQASWTQCKLWERAMPATRNKSSIMDTVQTVGAGHARDQKQIKHHGHSANCGSGPCREPSPPAKATSHPKMDSHPPC